MKKLLCFLCWCSVLTVPVQANYIAGPSLGWWYEGDSQTTHQYWDFTPGYVTMVSGGGYSALPESVYSPVPLSVVASISPGGTWDGITQFVCNRYISVNLEIPNYPDLNEYKEIWVDIGDITQDVDINVSATPTSIPFRYVVLPGQGKADFGIRIYPNPEVEKVGFNIFGSFVLDYIHVDTICIPEPATVCILSLGALILVGRKKQ